MITYSHHDGSIMTDELPAALAGQSRKGILLPSGRWARIALTPHRGHPFYDDNSSFFLCQRGRSKLVPSQTETLADIAARIATEDAIVATDIV